MSEIPYPEGNPITGDPRVGVRFSAPMASITIAATTTLLCAIPGGSGSAQPRTAVIRKIMWSNRNGGNSKLRIGSTDSGTGGTGGNFTQRLPEINMLAGLDGELNENDLPRYEFRSLADDDTDIVGQASVAAVSPNDIQVSIEVEFFGTE